MLAFLALMATGASAEESTRLSIQSTADFASVGSFYSDATALLNPFGTLSEPGLRLQITGSGNRYRLRNSDGTQTAFDTAIDVLTGYQFIVNEWSLLLAAGPSVVNSRLLPAPGLDSSEFD